MSVSSLAFVSSSGSISQIRSSSKGDSIGAGRSRRRHKVIPPEYHFRPLPDPKQPCGSGIAGDKLLLQSVDPPQAARVAATSVTSLPNMGMGLAEGPSRTFDRPLSPTTTRQQAELERRIAVMRSAMEDATADPFGADARALLCLPATIVNQDFAERYGVGSLPASKNGSISLGSSFAQMSLDHGQGASSDRMSDILQIATHRSELLPMHNSQRDGNRGAHPLQSGRAKRSQDRPFLRITDTTLPSSEAVSYSLQYKLDTIEARRALSELLSEEEGDRAWNVSRCWEEQRVIILAKEEFDRSVRLYLKALERRGASSSNQLPIAAQQQHTAFPAPSGLLEEREGGLAQQSPPPHRRDTQVPHLGPLVVDEVPKMMKAVQTLIIQQSLNLSMN